ESEHGAGCEPFEIARIERRVGCDDEHARPIVSIEGGGARSASSRRLKQTKNRDTGDGQIAAEVGLGENTDCVVARVRRAPAKAARRSTDAALPTVADGAGTGPHRSFRHRTAGGVLNRPQDVFARDVEA